MKSLILSFATALAFAAIPSMSLAQHSHGYVGDANGDGYLDAVSSDTGSGTLLLTLPTRSLSYSGTGAYADAGYDYNGSYTFSALHGSNSSVNNPQGALSGTKIFMTLYAVSGPVGANFAFFESDETETPYLAFSIATGTTGGTNSFVLTEELFFEVDPSDPFGHIHGRRFAADTWGSYSITWVITNDQPSGTGSSLDNPDSGLRYFTQTFNAVPEPSTWAMIGAALLVGLIGLRKRKRAEE